MAPRGYLRLALVFIPVVLKLRVSLAIPGVTQFSDPFIYSVCRGDGDELETIESSK